MKVHQLPSQMTLHTKVFLLHYHKITGVSRETKEYDLYVSGRENSPQYAHTYSSLLGMRRWVHITPYPGDPKAECLGWTTYHSSNIPTNKLLPTAQYYTQDSRLRKHIAYSNIKVPTMGDKPLTLVFSNTCHTCPLMSAILQGNEYLHTCYCSHCHNQ